MRGCVRAGCLIVRPLATVLYGSIVSKLNGSDFVTSSDH